MHSIIFEPQPQIQLTCSSYKVTSFLNFQPFLQGFQNVKNYLDQLWTDIWDPLYYEYLFTPIIQHIPIDPIYQQFPYGYIQEFPFVCTTPL